MDKLVKNPGRLLKIIAGILFAFSVIGFVVLAFSRGWDIFEVDTRYTSYTYTEFNAVRFFSILIGGPLAAFVECLLLYGFGELIEKTTETNAVIKGMVSSSSESGGKKEAAAPVIRSSQSIDQAYSSSPTAAHWKCACGRSNAQYVSTCACGKNKRDAQAAEPK